MRGPRVFCCGLIIIERVLAVRMPFKSEAQRRFFHAAAERGDISKKKVHEYESKTKGDLPERVGSDDDSESKKRSAKEKARRYSERKRKNSDA